MRLQASDTVGTVKVDTNAIASFHNNYTKLWKNDAQDSQSSFETDSCACQTKSLLHHMLGLTIEMMEIK